MRDGNNVGGVNISCRQKNSSYKTPANSPSCQLRIDYFIEEE